MKKIMGCVLFVFLANPVSLSAADSSSGCGPAWYILKDQSLLSSSARAITNGALYPLVTLGMTFGTSNCTKHSIVLEEKQQEQFISAHFDQLKIEIAQGHGNYLENFSGLLGCNESTKPILSQSLKQNFSQIYQDTQDSAMVWGRIQHLVKSQQELESGCQA